MSETLEYLQLFARFPLALRRFLNHTVTLDEARPTVRDRMQTPDARFLQVVERGIYRPPGKYATLVDLTKEFPQLQVNAVQARGGWLEKHPREVRDFIRALLTVHRRIIANRGELHTRALEQLKTEPKETIEVIDALIAAGAWDPNGALTGDNLQCTLSFLQDTGVVPKELRVEDVADLASLNDVLNEIGRQ